MRSVLHAPAFQRFGYFLEVERVHGGKDNFRLLDSLYDSKIFSNLLMCNIVAARDISRTSEHDMHLASSENEKVSPDSKATWLYP